VVDEYGHDHLGQREAADQAVMDNVVESIAERPEGSLMRFAALWAAGGLALMRMVKFKAARGWRRDEGSDTEEADDGARQVWAGSSVMFQCPR
jgi:hypothetical protein